MTIDATVRRERTIGASHPKPSTTRTILRGGAIAGAAGYGVLQWLGRTYGSTAAERAMAMPGDEVVPEPHYNITHAITIDAPPAAIWPWLIQVGWHRAGWYTARWVDRLLFPANDPSADRIIPELQHCDVGDFIPDGPPEADCGFLVEQVDAHRHLVLRSTTHLPLKWRTDFGARLTWSWTFLLVPTASGRTTRFVFRWRAAVDPWWVKAFCSAAIVPADAIMSHDMLHGLQRRAESSAAVGNTFR